MWLEATQGRPGHAALRVTGVAVPVTCGDRRAAAPYRPGAWPLAGHRGFEVRGDSENSRHSNSTQIGGKSGIVTLPGRAEARGAGCSESSSHPGPAAGAGPQAGTAVTVAAPLASRRTLARLAWQLAACQRLPVAGVCAPSCAVANCAPPAPRKWAPSPARLGWGQTPRLKPRKHPTASHHHVLAGHIARRIGQQEQDDVPNFARLAQPL